MAAIQLSAPQKGDTLAVMHTNMGDIKIKLFPEKAPKTVENFVTHSKNGYYNGLKFGTRYKRQPVLYRSGKGGPLKYA